MRSGTPGNGWTSRKWWAVVPLIVAGVGLTAWLMVVGRYELALGAFGITAGVAGGYNLFNSWQARSYSNHGMPPGAEA